jgi:hypothetical protein
MENQQHLMNTIGPMFVAEEQAKAAAAQQTATQVVPDSTGNVTLKIS